MDFLLEKESFVLDTRIGLPCTLDAQLQVAKEKARHCWLEYKSLLYTRNSYIPILKLSTEIFQEIFFWILGSEEDFFGFNSQCQCRKWSWLTVTQVCRHWREVALGCPGLWSKLINFSDADKFRTYIERSRKADLRIECSEEEALPWRKDIPEFINLIGGNASRFREFSFSDHNDIEAKDWEELQKVFVSGPLDRLRKLKLHRFTDIADKGPCYLSILSKYMPTVRLKQLSLVGLSILWMHPMLHGLTELHLQDIGFGRKPTPSELLDILAACPNLKVLSMISAGPCDKFLLDTRIWNNLESRSVSLPCLRFMRIEEFDFSLCRGILDSLIIPENVTLSLAFSRYPFTNPVPLHTKILERLVQSNEIKIWLAYDRISFNTQNSKSGSTIAFMWKSATPMSVETDHDAAFRSIPVLFGEAFWANVTCVNLDATDLQDQFLNRAFRQPTWVSLLEQFHGVRDLKILFSKEDYIEEGFVEAFAQHSGNQPAIFLCPALQTLELVNADFFQIMGTEEYEAFINSILLRKDHSGKILSKLYFTRCPGMYPIHYHILTDRKISEEIRITEA